MFAGYVFIVVARAEGQGQNGNHGGLFYNRQSSISREDAVTWNSGKFKRVLLIKRVLITVASHSNVYISYYKKTNVVLEG